MKQSEAINNNADEYLSKNNVWKQTSAVVGESEKKTKLLVHQKLF